jgi:NAD(P)-dependent dehydrogenase (short-subunit alcohol dehydrogenase family)
MSPRALTTGVASDLGQAIAGADRVESNIVSLDDLTICDLANPADSEPAINRLAGRERSLLINNAAGQPSGSLLATSIDQRDEAFAVNVRAAFIAVGAAYPALWAAHGAVVNIGPIRALSTFPGRVANMACKCGFSAFRRAHTLDGLSVCAPLLRAVTTQLLAMDCQIPTLTFRS